MKRTASFHMLVCHCNFHGKGTEIYKVLRIEAGQQKKTFGGKRENLRESNYPIIALYKAPPSMRASLTKSRSSQTTAIESAEKSSTPSKKSKTKNSQQNNGPRRPVMNTQNYVCGHGPIYCACKWWPNSSSCTFEKWVWDRKLNPEKH